MTYEFIIDIKSKPKQRARKGKYKNFYTPDNTRITEAKIAKSVTDSMAKMQINKIIDPIGVIIIHEFAPPISNSDKKQKQKIDFKILNSKRPDLDNLDKLVLDSLNKKLWNDDSQIVTKITLKKYAAKNSIRIIVVPFVEGSMDNISTEYDFMRSFFQDYLRTFGGHKE